MLAWNSIFINQLASSVFEEVWHCEVTSIDNFVRMVIWNLWEIIDEDKLESLSEEPEHLHWPEGDWECIVHQGVGMWHLYLLFINQEN